MYLSLRALAMILSIPQDENTLIVKTSGANDMQTVKYVYKCRYIIILW